MKLYRCGSCGQPTDEHGEPLTMSQIGLTKDLSLWDDAELVHGYCCFIRELLTYDDYDHYKKEYKDDFKN